MSVGAGFSAPDGGFTFVAPAQDACEGDACLIPGATPSAAGEADSLLAGDVRDGRVEG
ncbi:hypothetical protein CLV49_3257 [Labedella gwakjiensis]|uniref:Uncharacterized protein n=1 Tax=Labedella gwakjiensis TaxID=390269 RepID=A0A2P8H072_9MICO|nr:hypothetical protein CLV49_3257 [Labedella gwakjiensis]